MKQTKVRLPHALGPGEELIIDAQNPPENIEELVHTSFYYFTCVSSDWARDTDKLVYINSLWSKWWVNKDENLPDQRLGVYTLCGDDNSAFVHLIPYVLSYNHEEMKAKLKERQK